MKRASCSPPARGRGQALHCTTHPGPSSQAEPQRAASLPRPPPLPAQQRSSPPPPRAATSSPSLALGCPAAPPAAPGQGTCWEFTAQQKLTQAESSADSEALRARYHGADLGAAAPSALQGRCPTAPSHTHQTAPQGSAATTAQRPGERSSPSRAAAALGPSPQAAAAPQSPGPSCQRHPSRHTHPSEPPPRLSAEPASGLGLPHDTSAPQRRALPGAAPSPARGCAAALAPSVPGPRPPAG